MPLLLDCPACQRKLRVPDHLLGQEVKCPTCAETFTATGGTTEPVEPPTATGEIYQPLENPPPPRAERPPPPARRDEYEDDPSYADRPYQRRMDLTPHRGTMILVFGILSLFSIIFCPLGFLGIFGPIAWVMGQNDLREMRAGNMDRSGEENTNAGRICGIIGTIIFCLGLIACAAYFALVGVVVGNLRRF